MKKAALLIFVFLIVLTFPACAQYYTGKVIAVTGTSDISVTSDKGAATVKLNCAASPVAGQPFAAEAQKSLEDLILNKSVEVQVAWMDHSNRQVAKLLVDGKNVGALLAAQGLAWYDSRHGQDADIATAQAQAQAGKLGVWSQPNPVAPWDFVTAQRGIIPNTSGSPVGASSGGYGFNPLQNTGDAGTSWDSGTDVLSTSPYYGGGYYGGGWGSYGRGAVVNAASNRGAAVRGGGGGRR
ncbi:MAG: thermonuclease family protein [Candidatus Eremiobacteraeota bacterium]|nr:thermonuclease family protein [Candidatus Eremiobacteraeota bacterium]